MEQSFIEKQFPVSKVSKESYKERKAGASQTLTGLGKWWGRKPLILVRAAIIGCLMPASSNPAKDQEIFLRILSMDDDGLMLRKDKNLSTQQMYSAVMGSKSLKKKYAEYFDEKDGKASLKKGSPKAEIELAAFNSLGYDAKLDYCKRPENLENISDHSWAEINNHLGISAHSISELIEQLSVKRYGHTITVGDCFCGGGSIPFEAARIGCNAYGSDLNPVAGLLTWGSANVLGANSNEQKRIRDFRNEIFDKVREKYEEYGIERNEKGDRAISYIYCMEACCPECEFTVPLSPSWIISKSTNTIAELEEDSKHYRIRIVSDVPKERILKVATGTVSSRGLVCPHCGKTTTLQSLRKDRVSADVTMSLGLRQWDIDDFVPRESDTYQERLYAIRYERPDGTTYFTAPTDNDLEREKTVVSLVKSNFKKWQAIGAVPVMPIENGYNTDQLIRERGWRYWHQLFNPRQLLLLASFIEEILQADNTFAKAVGCLGVNRTANFNSKLCIWDANRNEGKQAFTNQALNTLMNWCTRSLSASKTFFCNEYKYCNFYGHLVSELVDARAVKTNSTFWITDPPYADAVNYHELSEYFLAWDKELIKAAMPDWYSDSKRILAVRGDEQFSQTMIEIYGNLTRHMDDNGMQVVMFTHSDPAVWAQLALIMWKAGLTVTAAWNIATETESGGLKEGNYVKGTVLLVLRKQTSEEEAFLDELTADIKSEVKKQIEYMQKLDDKEDPNFSDPDYVLAAYAASLKILTSYKEIGEIDLDYELNLAINDPSKSEVVKLIERAKKIAYDFIIPTDFDNFLWRELTPSERFYVKGLEAEKHGNYQVSTYQEYARGFGLSSYGQLMASDKANSARLKTPSEFAMRSISEIPEFDGSLLRIVLAAIHVAVKEEENPQTGLWHLKTTVPNYWDRRDMIKQLLSYIMECRDIDTMPHWNACGEMAYHIYTLVDNDRI